MKVKVIKVEKYPAEMPEGFNIGFNIDCENGQSFYNEGFSSYNESTNEEQAIKNVYGLLKNQIVEQVNIITLKSIFLNCEVGVNGDIITSIIYHDSTKPIQIVLTNENSILLANAYPELIVYKNENNISTFFENGKVYFYLNFLIQEHREIFLAFGAEIKEEIEI